MTTILQMFSFFCMAIAILSWISLKFVLLNAINNKRSIDLDNGLVLNRQDAIIWTNDGLVYSV